jgi:hypothetical protein
MNICKHDNKKIRGNSLYIYIYIYIYNNCTVIRYNNIQLVVNLPHVSAFFSHLQASIQKKRNTLIASYITDMQKELLK